MPIRHGNIHGYWLSSASPWFPGRTLSPSQKDDIWRSSGRFSELQLQWGATGSGDWFLYHLPPGKRFEIGKAKNRSAGLGSFVRRCIDCDRLYSSAQGFFCI